MTIWKRTSSLALAGALLACTSTAPTPPATSPAPATGARVVWEQLADAPTPRLEVAAAVVDGRLFVAGGLVGGGSTDAVEVYDPGTDRWRRGPDLPEPVHHAMGAAWRGSFVVIGGFADGSFSGASDRAYRLVDGAWQPLPPLRRARGAGGAVVIGDAIYVIGGQDGGALVAETERFDGTSWTDVAPVPTPRDHLGVATDGRFAYAAVGRRLSIDATLPRLERYDPRTDRWRRLPDAPTARGGLGVAVLDGHLFVVGGEGNPNDPDGIFDQVEAFVIDERRWVSFDPMPRARHGIGVGVVDERLLVAVGGPVRGGSVSTTLQALELREG